MSYNIEIHLSINSWNAFFFCKVEHFQCRGIFRDSCNGKFEVEFPGKVPHF